MEIISRFIVFEGPDGSGTTTQLERLEARPPGAGEAVRPRLFRTAEPTDSPIGGLIRRSLRGDPRLEPETLAYLFAADRREHLFAPNGIIERCLRGELVVCDRYILSSLVYQGLTCGEELPAGLNAGFPLPALIVYFDIDSERAVKRIERRARKDIYETLAFQQKVRERYLSLLPRFASAGVRVELLDASAGIEELAAATASFIEPLMCASGRGAGAGPCPEHRF
jgi:dTMP kinase